VPLAEFVLPQPDRCAEAVELESLGGTAVVVEVLETAAGPETRRRDVHLAQQPLGQLGGTDSPAGSPAASPAWTHA
jgi:hypothetical protein